MDALHLQARAAGMDAENLAHQFQDNLVFIGGVDTQDLLPFQSPAAVRRSPPIETGLWRTLYCVAQPWLLAAERQH